MPCKPKYACHHSFNHHCVYSVITRFCKSNYLLYDWRVGMMSLLYKFHWFTCDFPQAKSQTSVNRLQSSAGNGKVIIWATALAVGALPKHFSWRPAGRASSQTGFLSCQPCQLVASGASFQVHVTFSLTVWDPRFQLRCFNLHQTSLIKAFCVFLKYFVATSSYTKLSA